MAQLTQCKACNHQVAKLAKTCTQCGIKNPGMTGKDHLISLVIFAIIIFAVAYWLK